MKQESFSSVWLLLLFSRQVASNSLWPHDCSTPGLSVPHHLSEFAHIHSHCLGDAIPPPHPLTPSSPSALNLSQHQGFSNELAVLIRWPKHWSFSFSISLSNEYLEPISFRMDRLDLLGVQGTLRSLLQHHSSKATILWYSAYSMVQLSQPTTGKALTIWTFVGRAMSLLLNMLSTFV